MAMTEDLSYGYLCSRECLRDSPPEITFCLGNKVFTLVDESLTFEQAKQACFQRDMSLAGISNSDEHSFLAALATGFLGFSSSVNIWIGNKLPPRLENLS